MFFHIPSMCFRTSRRPQRKSLFFWTQISAFTLLCLCPKICSTTQTCLSLLLGVSPTVIPFSPHFLHLDWRRLPSMTRERSWPSFLEVFFFPMPPRAVVGRPLDTQLNIFSSLLSFLEFLSGLYAFFTVPSIHGAFLTLLVFFFFPPPPFCTLRPSVSNTHLCFLKPFSPPSSAFANSPQKNLGPTSKNPL